MACSNDDAAGHPKDAGARGGRNEEKQKKREQVRKET